MYKYSINKNTQSNGDHEIHKSGCDWEPLPHNREELGYQVDDYAALRAGKRLYQRADGCRYCCPAIHHS